MIGAITRMMISPMARYGSGSGALLLPMDANPATNTAT
jgi:hypothetical protein